MLPLYAFPRPAAFGIWLCLQGISFFAVLMLSMRLACLTLWPSRWLIVASAVLLAENPISWDLRNHNVNLIYLGLVLAGIANRSSSIGGAPLALSFNLKLYSASFFAGLGWWRDYRRLVSMLICSLVIALVPILLVGTSGFLTLMNEWVGQVAFTMSEAGDAMAPMSLRRGLAAMLGADVSSSIVYWLWRALQAMWILIVLSYFSFLPRIRHDDLEQDPKRLADACVLLMTPLPLSTWLVPYHAVVLLPACVLLLSVVFNVAWPNPVRAIALIGSAAYLILQFVFASWDVRSVVVYLSLALTVSALTAMQLATHHSEPQA
jgi:Glycosyltransferase family 87